MKIAILTAIAAAGLLPIAALAQIPPTPPAPPAPAIAPAPPMGGDHDRDRGPKVPVTYLGVETSSVPNVVSEQLGLAKGFGLVVDYVVPDGPAAVAGVQPNDILKMFNDQILTEPDQLAKLVRSNSEGTSVTLTVLRKGAETKLTAKLAKRDVPQSRNRFGGGHGMMGGGDSLQFGKLGEQWNKFQDEMGNMKFSFDSDTADQVRQQVREAGDAAREAAREGVKAAREGTREAQRAAREMRIAQRENGAVKTTRIDMGRAQIVYHDSQGELKIENVAGKKVLTAKDTEGRLVFSGPVETKEELDKLPPEVRQRFDKLEQKDLPNVVPPNVVQSTEDTDEAAQDADDDADDDSDNDVDDADESSESVTQVLLNDAKSVPGRRFGINTVVI